MKGRNGTSETHGGHVVNWLVTDDDVFIIVQKCPHDHSSLFKEDSD